MATSPPGQRKVMRRRTALKPTDTETPDEERRRVNAKMYLDQDVQAAMALHAWPKEYTTDGLDVGYLMLALETKLAEFRNGDLQPVEQMLYAQALALQGIFSSLSCRAAGQKSLSHYQAHLTLALKAQAQCRATLTAIAEIRNPRQVAFVKQANIANTQQVNNGVPEPSRAKALPNQSNELLEHMHGERLDTGAQGAPGQAHLQVEAVEELHRPEDTGRQGGGLAERRQGRRQASAAQDSQDAA